MQPAIFIHYIKMKSFNTKMMREIHMQKKKQRSSGGIHILFYMVYIAKQVKQSKKSKSVLSCYIISVTLAIQKVCSHEQFQCDLRSDGKFRYFCGAVGVADLVGEVHADLGQDVRRNLPEVHFIGFILSKLTCMDGYRGCQQ